MSSQLAPEAGNEGQGSPAWYLGPYFLLSVTLLLVTLIYPLARYEEAEILHDFVISAMLISSLYAVKDRKWVFRVLAVLLLPMLVGTWTLNDSDGSVLVGISAVTTMLFLLATAICVFTHVVMATRVDADMLFGSMAVYLQVGIIIALLLLFMHNMEPGSVLGSLSKEDPWGEEGSDNFVTLLYFSMITLSSVGYGDLVPVGPTARSVAVFTGIFGQLYVAVLVAKLVGVYTAQTLEGK